MRHSVFLRKTCHLPPNFDLAQQPCAEKWTRVEDIAAPVLDTMIRRAGWHFMCMNGVCSRIGIARTSTMAIEKALARALNSLKTKFNAAELQDIQVRAYLYFRLATVTLRPRHIQQHTSLDMAAEHLS